MYDSFYSTTLVQLQDFRTIRLSNKIVYESGSNSIMGPGKNMPY